MKKLLIISSGIILFLSGCIIKSLHPFYNAEDLVYEERMTGSYMDQDSLIWEIKPYVISGFLSKDSLDGSYSISYTDEKGVKSTFLGHLFELDGKRFMDFYPEPNKTCDNEFFNLHAIGAHSLARIEFSDTTFRMKWYNDVWLNNLVKNKKLKLDHEIIEETGDYTSYLLTASTDKLQDFIKKHGDDPQAFKRIWENKKEDKEKEAFVFTLKRLEK